LRVRRISRSVPLIQRMASVFPIIALSFLLAVAGPLRGQDDWAAINDKKAPQDRKDLEAIQGLLTKALPKAREATVCILLGEGSGSGVIVTEDGLVLTAAHVAGGTGKPVELVMEDGRKLKAETLGLDASVDCAMVRILEKGSYPHVEIDRDGSAKLGDWVFSLGHSGGYDKERGPVARIGRIVRVADSTFQSDCTLIGGDSGGPLFDLHGKLIGIHSRVGANLQQNMHVPMKEFLRCWDAMLKGEWVAEGDFAKKPEKGKGFLGFASEPAPEGGLRVVKVGRESPAEKAGIKAGDMILRLNGKALKSREELQTAMNDLSAGDKVTFDLLRGGKPETITFRLGER
jgi:serine protease Do